MADTGVPAQWKHMLISHWAVSKWRVTQCAHCKHPPVIGLHKWRRGGVGVGVGVLVSCRERPSWQSCQRFVIFAQIWQVDGSTSINEGGADECVTGSSTLMWFHSHNRTMWPVTPPYDPTLVFSPPKKSWNRFILFPSEYWVASLEVFIKMFKNNFLGDFF